ncbi:MAG: hypothetical protein LBH32_12080 [Dysgonamonadaceae bacterium]|jgi:hypothetical protein|nr:hypothetical protein [Dysgonamonadaceae bacterium]
MQNDFISDIQILDMVIDERMRGLEDIERQYPQQKISRTELEQYKAEKKRFIETNDKKCQQQYESFKALVADVCKAQPPLEALSDSAINATNAFPSALSFGRLRISHDLFKNGRTFVPRILAFPLSRALWIPSKKDSLKQNSFVGEVKNWVDFNARHQDNPLFYKVIILVSIPEQLTDKSMVYLERLLIHGPSCGMLPILLVDEEKCTTSKISKYEDLFKKITDKAVRMNELCPLSFKHLQIEEEKEQLPEDEEAR